MSTKTPKLEFLKPELTDVADITAYNENWDKLDTQLSKTNIYSYTELSQFGLSDSEMDKDNFHLNIDKIITKLDGSAATIMLIVQNDINPNLHASLVKKLNEDTSISFNTYSHAGWLFIRFSGEAYRPVFIETNLETANYFYNVWSCVFNKGASENSLTAFVTSNTIYEHNLLIYHGQLGAKGIFTCTLLTKSCDEQIDVDNIAEIISANGIYNANASGTMVHENTQGTTTTRTLHPVHRLLFHSLSSGSLVVSYMGDRATNKTIPLEELEITDTMREVVDYRLKRW